MVQSRLSSFHLQLSIFLQDESCLVGLSSSLPTYFSVLPSPRLDSIGIGGFSHDFGCLKGDTSPVMEALDSFGTVKPSQTIILFFLLGPLFPGLFSRLSNQRKARVQAFAKGVEEIAEGVLARAKAEEDEEDQSIIGLFGE